MRIDKSPIEHCNHVIEAGLRKALTANTSCDSIVNIAPKSGKSINRGRVAYSTSKAILNQLAEQLNQHFQTLSQRRNANHGDMHETAYTLSSYGISNSTSNILWVPDR